MQSAVEVKRTRPHLMRMSRAVALMASLAAASGLLAAQQRAAQPFRTSSELLTIQASVRDGKGQPVTDLAVSDFIVRIDGEPRPVVAVRLFPRSAGTLDNAVALPHARGAADAVQGRIVAIAVDLDSIVTGSEKAALESAAGLVAALSPADASAAIPLTGGRVELTRNHAMVAAAIGRMKGTAPDRGWRHALSWDEALAFERQDNLGTSHVQERECAGKDVRCPGELIDQSREMLTAGRGHVQTILPRLTALLDRLGRLRGPKHLILISAGLPFEAAMLRDYQTVATQAAAAGVVLSAVQLDQTSFDASARSNGAALSGTGYATGLGNLAASTGGSFYTAAGRGTGIFERIAADIDAVYEVGVESRPSDANGKPHRVEVRVGRPNTHVTAPAETIAAPRITDPQENLTRALAQPTDVAELPLEISAYSTHSTDPAKVRLVVSASLAAGAAPRVWGYEILNDAAVVTERRATVEEPPGGSWTSADAVELPPGRYRLRAAIVDAGGRAGVLEVPLVAGLRAAGTAVASDLIVGTVAAGKLEPRAQLRQDEAGLAVVELSSPQPLEGTTGTIELIRSGTADAALRRPLALHARTSDPRVVVADATLDLTGLTPGRYTASALLARDGAGFARVSRLIDITPGNGVPSPEVRPSPETATPAPAPLARNPELDGLLQRVGAYIAGYGEQASLIIGTERYVQRYPNPPLGQPAGRTLVAELALVKLSGTSGWMGFRDVIRVEGKPVHDREDRLQALFKAGTPDVAEARRIADESARFNIGPILRNFNEPTSALFFFGPGSQPRFVFSSRGETTLAGLRVAEIDFNERASPTLIRTTDGRDAPCQGTLWVNPDDGTVVRTKLVVGGYAGPGSLSTMDVTYARDPRLALWLPARMVERHEAIVRTSRPELLVPAARAEAVTAVATYSDFRRFETSATFK